MTDLCEMYGLQSEAVQKGRGIEEMWSIPSYRTPIRYLLPISKDGDPVPMLIGMRGDALFGQPQFIFS